MDDVEIIVKEFKELKTENKVRCLEALILGLSEDKSLDEVFKRMRSKPWMILYSTVDRVGNP